MLKRAILYKQKLHEKMVNSWDNPKHHFYNSNSYFSEPSVETSSWNNEQFVSVDENDEIIGYLNMNHDRDVQSYSAVSIINFVSIDDNASPELKRKASMIFAIDLKRFFKLMLKPSIRSFKIGASVANPAILNYIRLLNRSKYKWLCHSYRIKDDKLPDGLFYDAVSFKVFVQDVEIPKRIQMASDLMVEEILEYHNNGGSQ